MHELQDPPRGETEPNRSRLDKYIMRATVGVLGLAAVAFDAAFINDLKQCVEQGAITLPEDVITLGEAGASAVVLTAAFGLISHAEREATAAEHISE